MSCSCQDPNLAPHTCKWLVIIISQKRFSQPGVSPVVAHHEFQYSEHPFTHLRGLYGPGEIRPTLQASEHLVDAANRYLNSIKIAAMNVPYRLEWYTHPWAYVNDDIVVFCYVRREFENYKHLDSLSRSAFLRTLLSPTETTDSEALAECKSQPVVVSAKPNNDQERNHKKTISASKETKPIVLLSQELPAPEHARKRRRLRSDEGQDVYIKQEPRGEGIHPWDGDFIPVRPFGEKEYRQF